VAFEVDPDALRERVRRATGDPFIRGIHLRRVEVSPRDESWWAGRQHRRAWIAVSETDRATLDFIREVNQGGYRRLMRLLLDALEVGRVEFLVLPDDQEFARAVQRLAAEPPGASVDHHQVAQLREGRLVDQLQRPQLVD